jgi:hypothetical protein
MAAEIDIITAARYHQEELLAEAALRQLLRQTRPTRPEPARKGNRVRALLRRIAGAPSFA